MEIDDKQNLVLQLDDDAVFYHTPIDAAVFRANYAIIADAWSRLVAKGSYYQMGAGPKIAAMLVRDAAIADAASRNDLLPDGTGNPQRADALVAEISRLTMVAVPGASGWEPIPVDNALRAGKIVREDWDDILSELVFFTCHLAMADRRKRRDVMVAMAPLIGGHLTPLPFTGYLASLPTSTDTGATKAAV